MSIINELLSDTNYDTAEIVNAYAGMTAAKLQRLEAIAETLDEIRKNPTEATDDSLDAENPIDMLEHEFAEIEASLKPIPFTIRPIGPIRLAEVHIAHKTAADAARAEIERAEESGTEADTKILLAGLPIMLEARLAALAITEPATSPEQYLSLLEKFGAGMGEVVAAVERVAKPRMGVVVPKLPTTSPSTQG